MGPDDDPAEQLAADLAVRLRDAHRAIARSSLDPEQKGRVTRRLLALSDASKRDLVRASARLDVLLADVEAGRVSPEEP